MPDPRDEENEAASIRADGAELRRCKACGTSLVIVMGPNGRRIPLDARAPVYEVKSDLMGKAFAERVPTAMVSHFSSCSDPNRFSTKGKKR